MEKLKLLFFLICLAASNFLHAQNNLSIKGITLDSLNQPLVGATVMLMQEKDSLLSGFAITDGNGKFNIRELQAGQFIIQITYIGYGSFSRLIEVKNESIDFGEIVLASEAQLIDGVTVTASFVPIVIKKDTIEYNAAAFKTKPNAVVEDLLKKLPGVEVDKDGKIKAQGEEVQNILVDGKPFFDDDPKIASRNIPADIVNKVQVFDKKSEFSEFTGIDDGNKEKTINLAIKDGKNKGLFGTLKGAYGSSEKYASSLNLNRFTKQMQLSAIGNSNNINERAFSIRDYFDFMGGLQEVMSGGTVDFSQIPMNLLDNSGITRSHSGGLNFNYDFNKKTSIRSNYFYNQSNNITDINSSSRNILTERSFNNNSETDQLSDLQNHRLKVRLIHKIDSTQDISINTQLAFSKNENNEVSNSSSVANGILSNEAQVMNDNLLKNKFLKTDLMYRKKLKKKGRFLTSDFGLNIQDADANRLVDNSTSFFPNQANAFLDSIKQQQKEISGSLEYKLAVNYVEPIGKAKYLQFQLASQNNDGDREIDFFNRVNPTMLILDDELSNSFDRNFIQHKAGVDLKILKKKYTFSMGLDYQLTTVKNREKNADNLLNRNFKNILPTASLNYQLGTNSRFNIDYTTRIQVPSIAQMQPVVNNEDPLNIVNGNPNLSPEYIHQVSMNYSDINTFYFRSLFMGVNVQYIDDRIIYENQINDQLVRINTPINGKDEWQVNGYYDYSSPIRGINLKMAINGNLRFQQSNILINDVADKTNTFSWNPSFKIENKKKENIDIALGYQLGANKTTYQKAKSQNQFFTNHTVFSDLVWYINDRWTLETNLERQHYPTTNFGSANTVDFVNLNLNKSFLDGLLTVSLRGINLLDEDVVVNRNSFETQFNETIKNRQGRIIMLGVNYKIRSFGK